MAIHDPPYYRYPLLTPWDRKLFEEIQFIAKSKKFPRIAGSERDKNRYIIAMIRTQKSLHNWRGLPRDTFKQIKQSGRIDAAELAAKYPAESISKDVPAWATYVDDKIVSTFIDNLATKKIKFVGTDDEIVEFILRFILGQLGIDWESTILVIWEMLGNSNTLNIKNLNSEMKNFDYLKLFR